LSKLTTFRIGGPARELLRPGSAGELRRALVGLRRKAARVLVIGAGSNILAADGGVNAAVIKLDAAGFCKIGQKRNIVVSGPGVSAARLLDYCAQKGLSGLEFMAGIPGTVGGALAMNAGVSLDGKKFAIGDLVESAEVMDYNGNLKTIKKDKLKFSYRRSNLSRHVILSASFKLAPADSKAIRGRIAELIARRKATQDYGKPNAGCIFKNPPAGSAGKLIDSCGLKGRSAGGAVVSSRHANFILNSGNASSRDVLALISLIRKEVKKKFNTTLETEIKIWK